MLNVAIELDGEQHFKPINFGGSNTNESFEERIIRDNIKNAYCDDNNITLIRIPYWDFNNIDKILSESLNITA